MKSISKIIGIVALVAMVSCGKNKVDETVPMITILEPTAMMYTIDSTQTSVEIPISVTITDNVDLHDVHVEIMNTTDNTEVFHVHAHSHETTYSLDTTITVSYSVMKDHSLDVIASDHSGNESKEHKHFHVHVD